MKLIIAMDPKGGIGYKNGLPWKSLSGDLARFKRLTLNKSIVMGRATWESLPVKPLPKRTNWVVTSSPDIPNSITIDKLNTLDTSDYWLIGGAKLVKSLWHLIDEVHLTVTYDHFNCDVYIDVLPLREFSKEYEEYNIDHIYQIWKRHNEYILNSP